MVKIFLIRHAQSTSNKFKADTFKQFGLDPINTNLCLAYKLVKSKELIDAPLSEKGIKECLKANEQHVETLKDIKHVLCSPLRRCLQTARGVLKTEDLALKGVKLSVWGELREILCCQGDFPMNVEESMEIFKEFDFSRIEKDVEKLKEFFFINYLDNEESFKDIKKFISEKNQQNTKEENIDFMFDLLKKRLINNDKIETNYDIYTRTLKFKEIVKQYVEKNNVKDGELAIVAHLRVIKAWTSTDFNRSSDLYMGHYTSKNCEVLSVDI